MTLTRRALLAASVALSLLTGATAAMAEPVTINFWVAWTPGQPDAKASEAAIAEFETDHPDIKIKTQVISYDALHDKLITAIAGGDAPDMSWGLMEWFGELDRMGALADLTSQMNNWADKSAIYPNIIKGLSINGQVKGLPNYLGLRALLYHDDMLKAAGLTAPPATWNELIAASKKIKEVTGKPGFGVAGRGVRSPQELIMYLAQNGAEIAKKMPDGKYKNTWGDDPDELKRVGAVFAFYKRMLDEGAIPPQSSGWGWEEEDTNFALGQYAMVINGSWIKGRKAQNPEQMKDVRVTAPPSGDKSATFFEIAPLYVFKSKHPEQVWQFASFLLGKKVQSAVFPDTSPRSDIVGDDIWGKPFTSLTPIGISFPPIALGSIPRDMEEAIGRVLLKNEAPEKVAAWLGNAINKSLRQSAQLSAN